MKVELLTKQKAIELGEPYYFTGKPCRHGHIERRPVKTGVCLECLRISSKKVYAEKKEKILARQKEYRKNNPEKVKQSFKKYYEKNKEERSASYAKYRAENKQKEQERHKRYRSKNKLLVKEKEKSYRENNKEKIRAKHANRRASINQADGKHTASDIKAIFTKQKGRCAACKSKIGNYHVDHIEPISRGGTNWPENIQILCPGCNLSKHAKDPFDWAKERGMLL